MGDLEESGALEGAGGMPSWGKISIGAVGLTGILTFVSQLDGIYLSPAESQSAAVALFLRVVSVERMEQEIPMCRIKATNKMHTNAQTLDAMEYCMRDFIRRNGINNRATAQALLK
jgi:hypothetical protein